MIEMWWNGDSLIEKCSFKYVGYRRKRCVLNTDRKPIWEIDDSMCINRYAPKGMSYVDTVFTVNNLPYNNYTSLFRWMNRIITANLTVWDDDISYPVVKYLDNYNPSREVLMRFTLEEELGDYVETKITPILPRLGQEVVDRINKTYIREFTVDFDLKATYRYPFPWSTVWWIIIGTILYCASISMAVFCTKLSIRSQMASGKLSIVKRLKKSQNSKQEEEALL